MDVASLRAQGDRDLAERLRAEPEVARAIEGAERAPVPRTRRHLLGTAVRLTPGMAPDLHATADRCRAALALDTPLELYVAPDPSYNAYSYGEQTGRVFVGMTSSLLEAFAPDELAFVIGHELGHVVFSHHEIPVHILLGPDAGIGAPLALRLFQWQRWAEISSDRAGVVCAGAESDGAPLRRGPGRRPRPDRLEASAQAFFKLASGLRGDAIKFDIAAYLEQVGDIQAEAAAERERGPADDMRADWFASHPFSPLRLRAAQLFAESTLLGGARSVDDLEAEVEDLMGLMEPSYLDDRSEQGEAMRRLLLAGGVLVAAASGAIDDEEKVALERFLGAGQLPAELSPQALEADMAHRVDLARQHVPPLKRAQVIRDLCVIAMADGGATMDEVGVIRRLADAVEVDRRIIEQTLTAVARGLD